MSLLLSLLDKIFYLNVFSLKKMLTPGRDLVVFFFFFPSASCLELESPPKTFSSLRHLRQNQHEAQGHIFSLSVLFLLPGQIPDKKPLKERGTYVVLQGEGIMAENAGQQKCEMGLGYKQRSVSRERLAIHVRSQGVCLSSIL